MHINFRLKLFLEEFGVNSVVLNSELPVASRCHTVHQFNRGLYDYLLATDENRSGMVTDVSKRSKLCVTVLSYLRYRYTILANECPFGLNDFTFYFMFSNPKDHLVIYIIK